VPPADAAALGNALAGYVAAPERRLAHGRQARAARPSVFSLPAMVGNYQRVYEDWPADAAAGQVESPKTARIPPHPTPIVPEDRQLPKPNYAFAKRQRDLAKKQKKERSRRRSWAPRKRKRRAAARGGRAPAAEGEKIGP
jgi:hypothetical protein